MTGATGFLGNFVLRDLLSRERRIVVMLRPPLADSIQRLRMQMDQLGVDVEQYLEQDRLVFVEGQLPCELPESDWGRTDEILSCAASLQLFSNGNEEPHKTNVSGVERLIDWAVKNGVKKIHAVSTAYVCGSYTQSVNEIFHQPKPEFKTEYEHSKWIAESRFIEWSREPGRVLTIMRPSFLVGDSKTGYTTQYGGFYQLARIISILKDEFSNGDETTYVPLRIPGYPNDPQNFVPVDFASRIIAEIVVNEQRHGRIYHLTDPAPPTNDHVKSCLEDYFKIHGGYFIDPSKVNGHRSHAEALLWDGYDVITPRVTHNPVFIQDNTREVMEAVGVKFPSLDRDRVFTLLDFAVAKRWGQRANRTFA